MESRGPITLMTDFGLTEYVAQMKGVIHGINPQVAVIDLCHDVSPQNIFEGAFTLMNTVKHFVGGIHVAVVDPGVGGPRAPIVIECERGVLVGPDNGLLFPAATLLGFRACYEITNRELMAPLVSDTFHGRDIFAPVAAHISKGVAPSEAGPAREGLEKFVVEGYLVGGGRIKGRVGRVDQFGNIITNVPRAAVEASLEEGMPLLIETGGAKSGARFVRTYREGEVGEMVALLSSSGHLEVSVRNGSARDVLGCKAGDEIVVRL